MIKVIYLTVAGSLIATTAPMSMPILLLLLVLTAVAGDNSVMVYFWKIVGSPFTYIAKLNEENEAILEANYKQYLANLEANKPIKPWPHIGQLIEDAKARRTV